MVGGMALGGQSPGFDREGEDHRRSIHHRVGLGQSLEQQAEIVAAEITDRGHQLLIVDIGEHVPDVGAVRPFGEPLADLGRRGPQHPLILLVGHGVDAPAQRGPAVALVQLGQAAPVLDRDHVPAGRLEHRRQPSRRDVGHHAIKRLAVEVDDPQDLPELGHQRVYQRLPARAFVELGVADQRDLAPAPRDLEVPGHVAVRHCAPDRRRGPDPDRAGGEIGGNRVLEPAGIALQAAELAQGGEVALVQVPEQVLDRVQDGGGVGLDRDPVGVAQVLEVERGHDRDHGGRGGLVAAHLHS